MKPQRIYKEFYKTMKFTKNFLGIQKIEGNLYKCIEILKEFSKIL